MNKYQSILFYFEEGYWCDSLDLWETSTLVQYLPSKKCRPLISIGGY